MCEAVYSPDRIQRKHPTKYTGESRIPPRFAPEDTWHGNRNHETEDQYQWLEVPVCKADKAIDSVTHQ